jgi:hypothetical protein
MRLIVVLVVSGVGAVTLLTVGCVLLQASAPSRRRGRAASAL